MKYRIRMARPSKSELVDPDLRGPEYTVQQKSGVLGWENIWFLDPSISDPIGWGFTFRFVEGVDTPKSVFSSFEEAQEYVILLLKQDAKMKYEKPVTVKTYHS